MMKFKLLGLLSVAFYVSNIICTGAATLNSKKQDCKRKGGSWVGTSNGRQGSCSR